MENSSKHDKRSVLVCLLLAVGTAVLYWPTLQFEFITFDDPVFVVNNGHVNQGFSIAGLKWAWLTGYYDYWHPLAWMGHMLDCQWFGLNPAGHHAMNALWHVLNSVLVFLVFRRLTGAFWRSAVVAALFAWHPLHVESVAWVSERKDVLCAFFFLLAIWFYAGWGRQSIIGSSPAKTSLSAVVFQPLSSGLYWLALLCFALALLSKPMAVTLPFVLVLLDYWPLGRVRVESERGERAHASLSLSFLRRIVEKIPFLILTAGGCAVTFLVALKGGAIGLSDDDPLITRVMGAAVNYVGYLKNLFWPVDLALLYPRIARPFGSQVIFAIICLGGLTIAAIRQRKMRPYWIIGWLWYLGMLLPVIGFISIGTIAMADRFTYLPSLGIFMIVCWEINDSTLDWPYRKWILGGLAGLGLLAGLALSSRQLSYWQNSEKLFVHAIQVTRNNYIAHANYAMILEQKQQWNQACTEAGASIRIMPTYALGHALLGDILLKLNQPEKAAESARTALSLQKDLPGAHLVLGQALVQQGKMMEASQHLIEVIRLLPQSADPHYYYAVALHSLHQTKQSIEEYRRTLALSPNHALAMNNLAWILASDSDAKNRNGAEAVTLAERACALTQNEQAMMIGTLAAAYAEAQRFREAVGTAETARKIALAHGEKDLAEKNAALRKIFQANKPYHEP